MFPLYTQMWWTPIYKILCFMSRAATPYKIASISHKMKVNIIRPFSKKTKAVNQLFSFAFIFWY